MTIALLLAGLGAPAFAQAPGGRIVGAVRDAQGATVQRATVTVTSTATGAVKRTTTGVDGRYAMAELASGAYTVAASMVGYRRESRADVRVAGETTVDFTMQLLPLQAVTVTAALREQSLADVPFSVAATSAQTLRERGVSSLEDIATNVAGFSVQNLGPGQSQVAIRGASSGQIARDQPGVKEDVGAYLDDVPISLSLFTPDLDLFDVSRVEVLRGPQGTLFGSGSLSGTVRYISGQPELGLHSFFGEIGTSAIANKQGFGSGTGGRGTGASVKLGVNTPLGDNAAARIVGYFDRMPGFMDAVQPNGSVNSDVNDGAKYGVRAAIKFAPSDAFTMTPRIVYQHTKTNGWNRIDAFNILANPWTTSRSPVTLGPRQQFTQIGEPYTDDFVMGDVNMKWNWGTTNLTSVSSYGTRDILVVRDAGALTSSITGGSIGLPQNIYTLNSPLNDATKTKTYTQELRLAGSGESTRWLFGAFYSNNKRDYAQDLVVSGFQTLSGIPTASVYAKRDELFWSTLSYKLSQTAIFGEGTWTASKDLDLTAGARYYNFSEDRTQIFDGIFGEDDAGKPVSNPGSVNASGFVPRVMASWKASPTTTFNAQVSRGFRLGGINDPINVTLCTAADRVTFGGRNQWKDETAWNYEVGTKSELFDGKGSLNVSAFNMDISDLQLSVTAGSCSSRLVFNVPKARSQGVEVEFNASPDQHWDVSASASLNNSKLLSSLTSTSSTGVVSVVSGIKDGNRLPSVPQQQFSAAATYKWPLQAGWNGAVTGTFNHVGSRYTAIDDLAAGFGTVDLNSFGNNTIGKPLTQGTFTFNPELPAYDLLNLRFGVSHNRYEASLYANNLTDTRALLALDRERGTRARVGYLTNQPRTVGLNLRFDY
jgi:iron complex outermembrane receptor protein